MNDLKSKIIDQLKKMGVSPKKSLGQNFLVNDFVIQKIITTAQKSQTQEIIEVGPGLGALTVPLYNIHENLKVIELDREFAAFWRCQNIMTYEEDALKLDWNHLDLKERTLLASNLPYQISSSLVIDRSKSPQEISEMILMFQKEVAERITSEISKKSYGLLSVIAQSFWKIQWVCDAGPGSFYPPPKISSRVLYFQRKPLKGQLEIFKNEDEIKKFILFVKAAFSQRRKYLIKNLNQYLKSLIKPNQNESLNQNETLLEIFKKLDMGLQQRAEELSPNQFIDLYKSFLDI